MSEEIPNIIEENDTESQKSRAFLREKFLRFIAKLSCGQDCEVVMHENIKVSGKLKAFDLEFQNIIMEDLETPYLPVKRAIMRSSDIISIHMKNVAPDVFMH